MDVFLNSGQSQPSGFPQLSVLIPASYVIHRHETDES